MPYNSALDRDKIRKTPLAAPSKAGKFGDAFKAARAAGKKTFTWNGKLYNTKTKDDGGSASAKSAPAKKPEANKASKPNVPDSAAYKRSAATQTAAVNSYNVGVRASIAAGKAKADALRKAAADKKK